MAHILVVDDEPSVCELLADVLRDMGFGTAAAAYCAEEARLLLRHERFDAALVDIVMPGESGTALARDLETAGVPVLLMTGKPEGRREMTADSRACLHKPFDTKTLKAAFDALTDTAAVPRDRS